MIHKSLLALLLTVPVLTLAADSAEDELLGVYGSEELISIATGYKQPLSKAPAVASIITAEDIRRLGATDIDEVLETIPGMHVARSYQAYNPIYTVRGIYSTFNPQILMLINGIPQTNLFTGGRNFVWGGMPVEAIDRIEVIRGPGSAIHGADAFAGVINIITRDADTFDGLETGIRYGEDDSRSAHLTYGGKHGAAGFAAMVELNKTDGHDETIAIDAQTILDQLTGTAASRAPGPVNLSRESADIRLDYRLGGLVVRAGYQGRRDVGTGAGVAQALDPFSRYRSDRFSLDASYTIDRLWHDDLSLNVGASFLDVSQEVGKDTYLYPPGSTGPFLDANGQPQFGVFPDGIIGNPEVFERHSRLNATLHYLGVDDHDLSLGFGYHHGDLYRVNEEKNYCTDAPSCAYILSRPGVVDVSDTPFVFLTEGVRKNYYVYLQDILHIANDWELTAGVRYDHFSDFGGTLNPRASLVWSTSNRLTTKFLYGEAFRAPSFQEIRTINNPAALGNPDLEAESLRSFEIVFDYKHHYSLNTVFNTFYYEWDDIIQFIPDPSGGTNTAQNAGRQTGHGFELETKWLAHDNLDLIANYAWQRSTNTRTDHEAANAPQQQFYLQAHWRFWPDYSLNLQANWVMDRDRERTDPRDAVDDYVLVDLTLRRTHLWHNLDAALIVRNLFDEDAREPSPNGVPVPLIPGDLPLPGRKIVGELRYRF